MNCYCSILLLTENAFRILSLENTAVNVLVYTVVYVKRPMLRPGSKLAGVFVAKSSVERTTVLLFFQVQR